MQQATLILGTCDAELSQLSTQEIEASGQEHFSLIWSTTGMSNCDTGLKWRTYISPEVRGVEQHSDSSPATRGGGALVRALWRFPPPVALV